ncbi:glycosyltransferase family 1 protein [candidate division KSB1 bacterium]|nr:MAG: glycosyltransferase family 1 protein [candidate division KSB1 bacterium]
MYSIKNIRNIGFISTRLKGTDGVSLETEKWVDVLEKMRYNCFFFAGEADWPPERTMVEPLAHYLHPKIQELHSHFFGTKTRSYKVTDKIHELRVIYKTALYQFIDAFKIDMIIVENALSIPVNIPLGLAITEFIAETNIPAVGHHHDFYWERERFMVNCVNDYINMAFPPSLNSLHHVVINTEARKMLSYRRGLSSLVIPNVFNYDREPPGIDDYNKDVRRDLGLNEEDIIFLQPTRIVQRKGIESAIEVIHRLKDSRIKLVITHSAKDEGKEYYKRVLSYAELMDVPIVIKPSIFSDKRSTGPNGEKIYSIWDIYPHADFITYPSSYEGFGNAFLEAVFFKKPILVNRYSIYQQDIEPVGFEVVAMNNYVNDRVVKEIKYLLENPEKVDEMVEKNFHLASRFFSYEVLEQKLKTILVNYGQV